MYEMVVALTGGVLGSQWNVLRVGLDLFEFYATTWSLVVQNLNSVL